MQASVANKNHVPVPVWVLILLYANLALLLARLAWEYKNTPPRARAVPTQDNSGSTHSECHFENKENTPSKVHTPHAGQMPPHPSEQLIPPSTRSFPSKQKKNIQPLTERVLPADRGVEGDDGGHDDHHALHAVAHRVRHRGHALQDQVGDLLVRVEGQRRDERLEGHPFWKGGDGGRGHLDALDGDGDGSQEEEGHDGQDAEEIDIVQSSLACSPRSGEILEVKCRISLGSFLAVAAGCTAHAPWQMDDSPFSMNFFDSTFRDWKVMFDPRAARNPVQLKESSEVEASATPETMGTRDAATASEGLSPRKMKDIMTEKKGSKALTVCVKDTATARRDTLVSTLPTTWMPASGVIERSAPGSILGRSCRWKSHIRHARILPVAKCIAVQVMGKGNDFRRYLL